MCTWKKHGFHLVLLLQSMGRDNNARKHWILIVQTQIDHNLPSLLQYHKPATTLRPPPSHTKKGRARTCLMCLRVVNQRHMVRCSPHALEFSQSNNTKFDFFSFRGTAFSVIVNVSIKKWHMNFTLLYQIR